MAEVVATNKPNEGLPESMYSWQSDLQHIKFVPVEPDVSVDKFPYEKYSFAHSHFKLVEESLKEALNTLSESRWTKFRRMDVTSLFVEEYARIEPSKGHVGGPNFESFLKDVAETMKPKGYDNAAYFLARVGIAEQNGIPYADQIANFIRPITDRFREGNKLIMAGTTLQPALFAIWGFGVGALDVPEQRVALSALMLAATTVVGSATAIEQKKGKREMEGYGPTHSTGEKFLLYTSCERRSTIEPFDPPLTNDNIREMYELGRP